MNASERLVISLDLQEDKAMSLVNITPKGPAFKIGMKLFTASGPSFVRSVIEKGFRVFLDMKFHDIPNTVAEAAESAANMGVWMFNIHASGGPAMMMAAKEKLNDWSAKTGKKPPLMIAVTLLTSIDENEMRLIGLPGTPADTVMRWTEQALMAGCDGIVCSPQEIKGLRDRFGKEFVAVTPGIRRSTDAVGDQKRIATPQSSIGDGATYIVVGRPIIAAPDPAKETLEFIKEIENVK